MWRLGLVDEVRRLEAQGLREGLTARRALGYAQVLRMLDGTADRGAGLGGDGPDHPPLRPQATLLVQARPGHHLAPGRRNICETLALDRISGT